MYFSQKKVLITGASSGIGEALAYAFAEQNATVLLCARNETELLRVKAAIKAPCEIFVCDITNYQAVDLMILDIVSKYDTIDVLVNNAGMSQRGLAYETDFKVDERILNLNYLAPVYLTKKVLPLMISRNKGNIIVITSLSGKFGFWQRSAYAASKHALHGFFETLQIELKSHHINTLLVCPGGVKTNISKNALEKDGTPHNKMEELQSKGITPASLAVKILKASANGKKQILVGKAEVYLYYIKKWFPWLFFKLVEGLNGR
ncbi:MAG: SDR family oxidoreductase [Bacteroidetes bacterium]|nr:SDR family oxidoreductase [Bacteroidota bacterium]